MMAKYIARAQTVENDPPRFLTAGWSGATTIIVCLLPCILVGCAVVGPRAIKAGRVAYA